MLSMMILCFHMVRKSEGTKSRKMREGAGEGGGPHTGYLSDKRANPHAARDDAILPLLCRCSPLTRHPQLLVYLLPTTWILSSHSSIHSTCCHTRDVLWTKQDINGG